MCLSEQREIQGIPLLSNALVIYNTWLNHFVVSPFNSNHCYPYIHLYSNLSLNAEKPSLGMVVTAVLVAVLSWVTAIVVNVLTALVVGLAGCSMSWFTHTPLLLPLYAIPALLAMAEVHSFWLKNVRFVRKKYFGTL